MRINPIRLGIVGAVIASGSFLFAMSAGASTSASPVEVHAVPAETGATAHVPCEPASGTFHRRDKGNLTYHERRKHACRSTHGGYREHQQASLRR